MAIRSGQFAHGVSVMRTPVDARVNNGSRMVTAAPYPILNNAHIETWPQLPIK